MSGTEELKETIQQLEQKLKEAEIKQKEFRVAAENKNPVIIQTKPDKKISKFGISDDVDDWIDTVSCYISKFKTELEKVDFVLNHLEKGPYTEVRFKIDRQKSTASEVFQILQEVYGVKQTLIQLQQEFFTRQQEPDESMTDYSYVLMEKMIVMEKQGSTAFRNTDEMLKERFAEGIRNVNLRRELRRLNREQPKLKFFQLRDHADRWSKDEELAHEVAVQESVTLDNLFHVFQEQQQEIKKLNEAVQTRMRGSRGSRGYPRSRGTSRGRGYHRHFTQRYSQTNNSYGSTRDSEHKKQEGNAMLRETSGPETNQDQRHDNQCDGTFVCFYCGQPNHISRNCIKRKQDQRRQGYKMQTNLHHSK